MNDISKELKDIKLFLEELNKNIAIANKISFINLLAVNDPIKARLIIQLRNELF